MENNECSLIVVIVNKGFAELVMNVARAVGATGGTILTGRGTGGEKAKKFFAWKKPLRKAGAALAF